MADIIIKSFNRPFYLDRCLRSIDRFVQGCGRIVVVDDGTPKRYLDEIRRRHPQVDIRLSDNYARKQQLLNDGYEVDGFDIPTRLWRDAVQSAGEYMVVTEDDVWFTAPVDLAKLTGQMSQKQSVLCKLGWLGKPTQNGLANALQNGVPERLFTGPEWLMDLFFYNKFKFFSFLYKLKLVDNHTTNRYWALNSILMGLWHKDYWLHVWKDANGRVDEKQQLRNAAVWLHHRKGNPALVVRNPQEVMRTTFQSSATNSYHRYGADIDINRINRQLNDAWLHGKLDAMQNFPKDFDLTYLEKFFDAQTDPAAFHAWADRFKEQYRALGATVD